MDDDEEVTEDRIEMLPYFTNHQLGIHVQVGLSTDFRYHVYVRDLDSGAVSDAPESYDTISKAAHAARMVSIFGP